MVLYEGEDDQGGICVRVGFKLSIFECSSILNLAFILRKRRSLTG